MPAFAVSAEGPRSTPARLGFVAVSSLVLWCVFVFFQDIALLGLTSFVCAIGVGSSGRTSMMPGVVQLVLFAALLFLAAVP